MPHSDIHGSKPARGSPWLFAACHVLRRLLVPRHPPNALLSLEIRYASHNAYLTMHRNHPQESVARCQSPVARDNQNQRPTLKPRTDPHTNHSRSAHNKSPLNTRHPTAGALIPCETALPVRHAAEQRTVAQSRHRSPDNVQQPTTETRQLVTRPETHQNLIHPDKEQSPTILIKGDNTASRQTRNIPFQIHRNPDPFASPRSSQSLPQHQNNGGGDRDRTDDPLLAKQVLSQLSYTPKREASWAPNLVGQGGFEPPTPRLSSVCSNQLSY